MKKIKLLCYALILCFTFSSCSDDEDSGTSEFDGSIESVEDFFNPEVIDAFQELGFTINTGNNPPQILEGSYLASPFVLQESSVTGDNIGSTFSNYIFEFSNQNNGTLTIDFVGSASIQEDIGYGSFISGSNDSFSVFLKITSTYQGATAEFAYAMSGKVTEGGIMDYEFINLMLDDNGDPQDVWIENNTGRLLIDSDGFSPLTN